MTIKIPLRNLLIRDTHDEEQSVSSDGSSSSSFFKLGRRRRRKLPQAITDAANKSVSFDCSKNAVSETTDTAESPSGCLWYNRREQQQFQQEAARQVQLHLLGKLKETDTETSLGLTVNPALIRCRREYCYDAVLGEQARLLRKSSVMPVDGPERLAEAYAKVQQSLGQ